ncbi:hypothetical protein BDV37DRAFT_94520 [Aspergillus pseudonomiae]|uniref:Uncharacterized protein n=1 Tax=Aspergillus pseudonomiae TaxID=1506151 RepID=A0A5N7DG45_9EURO|nr:uncharacterized protein BDV37DRAFT_94520 [Aspergillus pseudonomiae]KAE8405254.1 hypothetical protein BDV37DRAFT_94520 [Aspergillus pseudonomiae]
MSATMAQHSRRGLLSALLFCSFKPVPFWFLLFLPLCDCAPLRFVAAVFTIKLVCKNGVGAFAIQSIFSMICCTYLLLKQYSGNLVTYIVGIDTLHGDLPCW